MKNSSETISLINISIYALLLLSSALLIIYSITEFASRVLPAVVETPLPF